jgi:pimeloyl-ACP methyl ester carboxylesterase
MRSRRSALLGLALMSTLFVGVQQSSAAASLRIGSVTLHRCTSLAAAVWCGQIRVPLDYAMRGSPRITIGFQWMPALGTAQGTVLAVEGGPGYSSTGSKSFYSKMLGSLRSVRNLLTVDLRGTGTSTPVVCSNVERDIGPQSGPVFDRVAGACGASLDHIWRGPDGRWIHAADLFNTANSARDTATVLRAMQLSHIDLYGDSYGSWFSQVFTSRYPKVLRSVTLDSTYQVLQLRPWYVSTVTRARIAFDNACQRAPACARIAPGSAWRRIVLLAHRLRRSPVFGETPGSGGSSVRVKVGIESLVDLVNNAGFDPMVYRDLDAAARALLNRDDAVPLVRLWALSRSYDDVNVPLPFFSDGLYIAASCTDYPQLFSRTAPPVVRARQFAARVAHEPASVFSPFSAREWTLMPYEIELYNACLDWPTKVHHDPPILARPPLAPPNVPVLILSGDMDSLTPASGAFLVKKQMGPSARVVLLHNLTHVTAEGIRYGCASSIYRSFVANPGALAHLDVSCAKNVPEIHTVPTDPRILDRAIAATPLAGNGAGPRARKAAAVAVAAVGDEVSREPFLSGSSDPGARGGVATFTYGPPTVIRLHGVRWVADATVDGTATWSGGQVTAHLVVHAKGLLLRLTASWQPDGLLAVAHISGRVGGKRLVAQMPAP